jgi:hypothetical protein
MLPDFKLSVRPNNQVTLTLQNCIKRSKTYEKIRDARKIGDHQITRFVRREADKCNLKTYYDKALHHERFSVPKQNFLPLPLALINRFQRAVTPPPREKLGYGKSPRVKYFSARAGQKIRETGAVFDSLCGGVPENARVVTFTIPSSDEAAYKAISDYSGYATNRIFQVIRRKYPDTHWFYCWEHQKRGALHMHLAILPNDISKGKEIGDELGCKWYEVLQDISNKSGVDMLFSKGFGRRISFGEGHFYNQAMRKGCGAYFSKYASKNSGKNRNNIDSINARKYPPSSFWGRSRELKRMCDELSYEFKYEGIDDDDSQYLYNEALKVLSPYKVVLSHSFGFKKEIEVEKGNSESSLTICEGMSFVYYFSPIAIEQIRRELKEVFDYYKESRNLDLRKSL